MPISNGVCSFRWMMIVNVCGFSFIALCLCLCLSRIVFSLFRCLQRMFIEIVAYLYLSIVSITSETRSDMSEFGKARNVYHEKHSFPFYSILRVNFFFFYFQGKNSENDAEQLKFGFSSSEPRTCQQRTEYDIKMKGKKPKWILKNIKLHHFVAVNMHDMINAKTYYNLL